MSWYGNLEGVGELSEEDKVFIEAQNYANPITGESGEFIGTLLIMVAIASYGLLSLSNEDEIIRMLRMGR